MGVRIVLNHKVTDLLAERDTGRFDAVFVAIGAHVGKHADIPARDAVQVLDAVKLLRDTATGDAPLLGRKVVVYGGGNTAMDAARSLKRLGADEALIIYRRDRAHMPAHESEADEALAEGVKIQWLTTIKEIVGPTLTVERMALDDKGRPQPTGELDTLQADAVVLALGQDADSDFLKGVAGVEFKWDTVVVDGQMMTGHPGLFAGGDMVPAERTVTVAIGHGKLAARHVDAWLRGTAYEPPPPAELATFDKLNTWYYSDAPKTVQPELSLARRRSTFEEVKGGLDEGNALFEARRCLSCGTCFACDNCYGVCPDNAVVKLGPGAPYEYEIDLDFCKGCGLCAAECPCGAITMLPETI
jgi:NADPH-dependent glutamate synthase beta subunit-like oxidoreductase